MLQTVRHSFILFLIFIKKKTGRNIHEWQKHILFTYMCTGRSAAASEHRTRNLIGSSQL